ncbi:MAG TPA: hypothetical protein VFP84_00255, partial [Kofleriaceae bacterium]|nr:hypothetical protein [Kofleriaceae bacterium]
MTGEVLEKLLAATRESGAPMAIDCALSIASALCARLHERHEAAASGKFGGVAPASVIVGLDGTIALGRGGDPAYEAPEQAIGGLDRRSDVFAVGVILYEMTTGDRPVGDAAGHTRPSLLVPGYPLALEAIVLRALASDPARRYPTAQELEKQLEAYAREHRIKLSPQVVAQRLAALGLTGPFSIELDPSRARGFVDPQLARTLGAADGPASLPAFDDSDVAPAARVAQAPTTRMPPIALPPRAATGSAPPVTQAATIKMPALGVPAIPAIGASGNRTRPTLPGVPAVAAGTPAPEAIAPRSSAPMISALPGARASSSSLGEAPSLADTATWLPTPASEGPRPEELLPVVASQAARSSSPSPALVMAGGLARGSEPPGGRLTPPGSAAMSAAGDPPGRSGPGGPRSGPEPGDPPGFVRPDVPAPPGLPQGQPRPGGPVRSRHDDVTLRGPRTGDVPPPPVSQPTLSGPGVPSFGPAAPGARMSSSAPAAPAPPAMPVPNHPGAVPIMTPAMALSALPMVPSGGTLVSSAVTAGKSAQASSGTSTLSGGLVGRAGQNMAQHAQGFAGQPAPYASASPPVGYATPGQTMPGMGPAALAAPMPHEAPPAAAAPAMAQA